MEQDKESIGGEAPGLLRWRVRLPTALVHLLVVELFHVYLAVFSWCRLVNNVNSHCAMREHFEDTARIERYFSDLFFLGSTGQELVDFKNVSDPFFLGHSERVHMSVKFNGTSLLLPATSIDGANVPWIVIAWTLPIGACLVILYVLVSFNSAGIWSFESGLYLDFTWHIFRRSEYKWCIGIMASGPVLLPILWLIQIIIYDLENQLSVLEGSSLSGLLLLFALSSLAFKNTPIHHWRTSEEFLRIKFRRSILHLFFSNNASFGMKVVDALWVADYGDLSRLKHYLADASQADIVHRICRDAQASESKSRHRELGEDVSLRAYGSTDQ